MKYVIGIDLGTSAVKTVLLSREGNIVCEQAQAYPLSRPEAGWSEQNPEDWVQQTLSSLRQLMETSNVNPADVEGISFSGQMHGLVLIDAGGRVIRQAILWNDTRTTEQCRKIERTLGDELLNIACNRALEGFTLPKLLWVKEHEPQLLEQANLFLLPKDYLRYRLTGNLAMDYSDAAGTLLLDVRNKCWSSEIAEAFDLPMSLCPTLVESFEQTGTLLPSVAEYTKLLPDTKVFAGGADNACGAIGAGILSEGKTMCSIGTSGVILSYEHRKELKLDGRVHFFNHGEEDAFYTMGVTLAAGHSLTWFKETFAKDLRFDELLQDIHLIPAGSEGILFTPYISGERTPHPDADIRGSLIGLDAGHTLTHAARAVLEGITFSLRESLEIMRQSGKEITEIVAIGGGSLNETWLQMQADIFEAPVVKLENEQGPAMGAAMLAAYGCGWFSSLRACAEAFIRPARVYNPNPQQVEEYRDLFALYQQVYGLTYELNRKLAVYRR